MSGATKLYVGNLPDMVKEKDLRDLFQSFGDVSEVAVLGGYGFIHFHKPADATAALDALDGSEFMGSRLLVQFSKTKGHGYGRGSGPPRPRGFLPSRGSRYRRDSRERDRDSYRRGGDSYRRDDYRDSYRSDSYRDKDRYSSSSKYDRTDSYYDDLGSRKYSDSRGRSRSPVTDYYSSRDRDYRDSHDSYRERDRDDSYRDYKRESYRDRDYRDGYRERESRDGYRERDSRDGYRDRSRERYRERSREGYRERDGYRDRDGYRGDDYRDGKRL